MVYNVLLAALAVLGALLCGLFPNQKSKLLYSSLACAMLTAISGMRFIVGTDYFAYWEDFLTCFYRDWNDFASARFEKGYLSATRLISNFSLAHNILFWAFGLLFAVTISVFIYRHSSNLTISFFAFVAFGFLYNSMCFLRQYTALLVILYALQFIEHRHFFRYAIMVLFASTFHASALVMLPFYWILRIPLNKFILPISVAVCGVLYLNSEMLISLVTKVAYRSYSPEIAAKEIVTGTLPGTCIGFLILLLVVLLLRGPLVKRRAYNSLLINLLYYGSFFELVGTKHAIISRLAIFFMTPAVVLLTAELAQMLIGRLQKTAWGQVRRRSAAVLACMLLMAPMGVYHQHLLDINYNGVMPYQSIFSQAYQDF